MTKTIQTIAYFIVGAVLFALVIAWAQSVQLVQGSVSITNDYQATTTSAVFGMPRIALLTATSSTDTSCHQGTFGSFVHIVAGTGNINIYDATTTSVLQRAQATSSILIASLATAAAAGTYTFDVEYKCGLLVVTDGTVGTTTMTLRKVR